MKKALVAVLALTTVISFYAKWAHIPLEWLVQDSDLIVVGTLTDISEWTRDGIDYAEGTILVQEVLWGETHPGDRLKLAWQNKSAVLCPRVTHQGQQDQKRIWLLTYGDGDEVRADYPWRAAKMEKRDEVVGFLNDCPVTIRRSGADYTVGQSMPFTIISRNATSVEREVPFVETCKGRLILDSRISLVLNLIDWGDYEPVPRREGRMIVAKNALTTVLGGGEQNGIEADLDQLFVVAKPGPYSLEITVEGQPTPLKVYFYIKDPDAKGEGTKPG